MNDDMKTKIIGFLQAQPRKCATQAEIQKGLGIEGTLDYIAFDQALRKLEQGYEIVRNKNNELQTKQQAGYIEGKLKIRKTGNGSVERENGPGVKVSDASMKDAMDGDRVLLACDPGMETGSVIKVLDRAKTYLVATFYGKGRNQALTIENERLNTWTRKVITNKDIKPLDGLKVLCRIVKHSNPLTIYPEVVIGFEGAKGVDIKSLLVDKGISIVFGEEVLAEADAAPTMVSEADIEGRRDLREETIVTIDGDDSKDFDDAVSVEKNEKGWLLKVSIADVSHYVQEGTALDKEAFERGCSTYALDTVEPMLPETLSNGICSLNPHEDRLTLTCQMQVTPEGNVESYEIYPSVIRSTERMTYKNVNKILDGDEELCGKYAHLGNLLFDLRDCADAIRSARNARGAIDFDTSETEVVMDKKGHPVEIKTRERGHAERIIEDCMIAANVTVASYMKWLDVPAVYRVHEAPGMRKIRDFVTMSELMGHKFIHTQNEIHPTEIQKYLESVKDTEVYQVLSTQMLKTMKKAMYDETCAGHFGLAESEYLHFTSPIRRYPDLQVHRMLWKYCFNACPDAQERAKDTLRCSEIAEQATIREKMSQDAEYAAIDMKVAEYMEDHIHDRYEGIVSAITNFGMYVELPNTVEGLVRIVDLRDDFFEIDRDRCALVGQNSGKTYSVGMKVIVECVGASKNNATVDFKVRDWLVRPEPQPGEEDANIERRRFSSADRPEGERKFFDDKDDMRPRKPFGDSDDDTKPRKSFGDKEGDRKPRKATGKPATKREDSGTWYAEGVEETLRPKYEETHFFSNDSYGVEDMPVNRRRKSTDEEPEVGYGFRPAERHDDRRKSFDNHDDRRSDGRRSFGDRDRKSFDRRDDRRDDRRKSFGDRDRKSFDHKDDRRDDRKRSFGDRDRKSFDRRDDRRDDRKRSFGDKDRRSFDRKDDRRGRDFGKKSFGDDRRKSSYSSGKPSFNKNRSFGDKKRSAPGSGRRDFNGRKKR